MEYLREESHLKTRIFIGDAFLYKVDDRKRFYSDSDKISESLKDILKSRSITPIDHFSGKATVPLKFEYTTENFLSEITVNNISLKELKTLYFILRDSINGELRIGNSKTRGFGQIELEIEEMVYYKYFGKKELVKDMNKYFERVEKKSIKIGDKYLCEVLKLKENFNKIDVENPNEFIKGSFCRGGIMEDLKVFNLDEIKERLKEEKDLTIQYIDYDREGKIYRGELETLDTNFYKLYIFNDNFMITAFNFGDGEIRYSEIRKSDIIDEEIKYYYLNDGKRLKVRFGKKSGIETFQYIDIVGGER